MKYRVTALLIAAAALLVQPFRGVKATGTESPEASYSHGTLRVNLPYHLTHSGAGQLTVEVLDPEDQVLGSWQRQVDAAPGKGSWQADVRLTKEIPVEDLVWHRVRYRFKFAGVQDEAAHGIESISQILRQPVMHILGQQSYLTGGAAAVRVIVTDSKNEIIAGQSSIRIELLAADSKPHLLFTGRLNQRGTTEAQFLLPAGLAGQYPLRYVADTPIGSTEFIQQVRLEEKASILLTTEKPIYQPGQTIHVRALSLDRSNHAATVNRPLTFEVEDSRGNKVFKKVTQTDKFGISSAEFALADEVNLGTYHLRAIMGEPGAVPTNTAEIALNVQRYVLPKFKVAVDLAGDKPARHGYRPGDHVTGTVRSNYFFGKPVERAEITVKASGMDVAVFEAASVHGKTDAEGAYRFDLQLPHFFAGRPLAHGAARVLIEAEVKDSAGHSETRGEPITVSESPLILTAVPEGGTLIPNLENQVFILASYADGKPAVADIRVRDQSFTTDAGGVGILRLKTGASGETLKVEASDKDGNHATASLELQSRPGADQILLRTERAVYRAGDRIQLKVFSTKTRGTAYVDVVKEGQTVLTRDVEIVNGQAELSLTATPDMAGTLDFNAYVFGGDARPVADHRLVFVQPAEELKIEAKVDAAVYKPGDDARIRFRVTNGRGEGVQAALGLQVVDEAVFALAEKQPGFAKVFFYLEQEVMKPRYEIHSIGMPEIVEPVEKAHAEQRDRAARALFSATEMVRANKFETEIGRAIPQTKRGEYGQRYQTAFVAQARQLATNLTAAYSRKGSGDDLKDIFARMTVRDAWDSEVRIEHVAWDPRKTHYILRSAGADRRFGTGDDLAVYMEVRSGSVLNRPESYKTELTIEHDRGPFNGLAQIAGSVIDSSGAVVAGARVEVREVSTGKIRTVRVDDGGQFTIAAVPAGAYKIQISSPGFEMISRDFTLNARDRAVLSATLKVGSVNEAVMVVDGEPAARFFRVGGVAGGVPGGVIMGGIGGLRAFEMVEKAARPAASPVNAMFAANTLTVAKDEAASPAPRVRSYFPEALYINPEIITDQNGSATISIPLADSITTWRMAMLASTTRGALGSGTSSIKVFQTFFVDLDLPVTLTQGDRVSIPVAVYNYSGARGDVGLQLQKDDWFSLVEDNAAKTLAVESGRVGGAQFTVEAKRIGKFKLTLSAKMTGAATGADIVVREIEVIPNGREQNMVFNGRLENMAEHALNFPASSIPDASKIFVRMYPGPLSQVIEGMDSILRMPGGCFEQTSSSTYPNVLALDYMKHTKKLAPEVHAKAEAYIANGYQRLLTFEVPGGGFSWFGQAPANKILTAYGLMEFYDMSQVHDVDPKLIQRTQQWLASQQQPDGSWKPDTSFINEGATNRYNSDVLRITAYIAWSLENTGYQGESVARARQFVGKHLGEKTDAYTLAVLANFAVDYGKDRDFARRAMELLLDARTEKDDQIWWTAAETSVYATGASASVETTGLAAQALLKWGQASGTAVKVLNYIAAKKDASGAWGTTQATIMALRSLLIASGKNGADVRGTLEISLNGKPVEKITLSPDNNDLLHQVVLKNVDSQGANNVRIRFEGKGSLAYQVVGRYFVPWDEKSVKEPLAIDVTYDRTRLAQDEVVTATATVKNNLDKTANMVMVDLGIPPGFDLLAEDLQGYVEKSAGRKGERLEKFSLTSTQAILYFDSIGSGKTINLSVRLRAKYPIRARTFASRAYEYYDPQVNSMARPVQLEVRKR
jgi:uncharacterized protein YfaS (alpha-2-macroglobulin family)